MGPPIEKRHVNKHLILLNRGRRWQLSIPIERLPSHLRQLVRRAGPKHVFGHLATGPGLPLTRCCQHHVNHLQGFGLFVARTAAAMRALLVLTTARNHERLTTFSLAVISSSRWPAEAADNIVGGQDWTSTRALCICLAATCCMVRGCAAPGSF